MDISNPPITWLTDGIIKIADATLADDKMAVFDATLDGSTIEGDSIEVHFDELKRNSRKGREVGASWNHE